jgi:16S rRNA (guanine966-N2)-methyltransferase
VTRIVSGTAGGRTVRVPTGRRLRPTSARAREGLFSTLEAIRGPLGGAVVLDLFAGSGAVGLEALSRGAARAVLVERDPVALRTLRDNARALGFAGAQVVGAPVARFLAGTAVAADVVFLDPPYGLPDPELAGVVAALERGWLAAGGVVAVERASRAGEWLWPAGWRPLRARRYGEATVWYGRAAAAETPPTG